MSDGDRLLDSLEGLIRAAVPRLFYVGLFDYTITAVNGDAPSFTCDVEPVDPDIGLPDCNAVAILASVSSMSTTPDVGMSCVIAFLDGNPKKPRLVGIEVAGANPVARLGDQVMSFLMPSLPIVGTAVIGGTPTPITGFITVTNPISGTITQGSGRAVTQ